MKSKALKRLIVASLMSLGFITSAYAGVPCPDASEVKDSSSELNGVIRMSEKGFFVLTVQPAINASNLSWIVVSQASATGYDAAHKNGTASVKSVIAAMTPEAIEQNGAFICPYITSAGGLSVMAVAQQQQGLIFNPSIINFDAITAKK